MIQLLLEIVNPSLDLLDFIIEDVGIWLISVENQFLHTRLRLVGRSDIHKINILFDDGPENAGGPQGVSLGMGIFGKYICCLVLLSLATSMSCIQFLSNYSKVPFTNTGRGCVGLEDMLVWVFACRTIRILSIPSSFVITSSAFNWNLYGPASIVRAGRFMGILIVWTGIGLVSTFTEFLTILDICLSTSCCSVNFRLAPCKSNMIIFLASNKRWE